MIRTEIQRQWLVYLGFVLFGVLAGFIVGSWYATSRDVIAQAEKIISEARNA